MQVGTSIEPVPPTGDSLSIDIVLARSRHGGERAFPAMDWVIYEPTGQRLTEVASAKGWRFVFGGSRMGRFEGREVYHADVAGEFIGLTTFGGETVSFSEPISHEEGRQTPLFRVDPHVAPVIFTPFKVRITRAK